MNMMTIKCPGCGGEAKLSLVDTDYSGPRRCWKCHEYFTITIYHNQLTSCVPLSKEEYEKQQETQKLAEKSRGGIDFSQQGQLAMSLDSPKKSSDGMDFSSQEDSGSLQKAAEQSRGGIDFVRQEPHAMPPTSPEKPQGGIDFIKREEPAVPQKPPEKWQDLIKPVSPEEPSKPATPGKPSNIFPPDPPRTFVPLEDIKEEPEKPQKSKKRTDMFNPFIPPAT